MKSIPIIKKQVLVLFVFSILMSIAMIIHGIYIDLDFSQIKRLTIEGLLLTILIIFPAILFLEWIFDMNNKKRLDRIEKMLKKRRK